MKYAIDNNPQNPKQNQHDNWKIIHFDVQK